MITKEEAQKLVLQLVGNESNACAIQSCELSFDKECWVVRANNAEYVLHGQLEYCRVGVNAYLVDISTAEIDIVGSNCSVEQYLADRHDLRAAAGKKYVLRPAFDPFDPKQLIHLHQKIGCSLLHARKLARDTEWWFTGKRRVLIHAQELLENEGIASEVTLATNSGMAPLLSDGILFWDEIRRKLHPDFW